MSFLIYCIISNPLGEDIVEINGIGNRPIFVIQSGELAAVVSDSSKLEITTDTAKIVAYNRVVEAFHQLMTVIPLRYGSTCTDELDVVKHIGEQSARYLGLLRELDDCVEMGIRVKVADIPASAPEVIANGTAAPVSSGRSFLNNRRAHYALKENHTRGNAAMADTYREAFAGLFRKYTEESPTLQRPLLSLYFLVPRSSVETFRETFRNMSAKSSTPLLLSGPWPPYNFVCAEL